MNSSVIISFINKKKIHTKLILFIYAYCGYSGICSFNYSTVTGLVSAVKRVGTLHEIKRW